jgi:EAL domain-containing protein (putative c-di-GMP-specific phosphodiesterase class I)/ActR/RegA family two-component response regulator
MSLRSARRVLVLDDDEAVARTMCDALAGAGHEARSTTSADRFFALLAQWEPSHLVVDLVMPEVDGLSILGSLAESGCKAPIIISSGMGGRVLAAAQRFAVEHGLFIAGVLPKPFTSATLDGLLAKAPPAVTASNMQPDSASVTAAALSAAIARGRLGVAFQPKFALPGSRLCGFEALARWHDPEHGHVPPSLFVPLAERHGLIDALTETVLQQALSWFASLPHGDELSIAVNVSAPTMEDPDFARRLTGLCRDHGVAPEQVTLELTETIANDEGAPALGQLTRLRLHGFQIALDDFGTGHATMTAVARLPFSELKVDRSFVMGATTSNEDRAVVASVIDLGRNLGLRTCAEGIEDADTLALLTDLGADVAQGFYLGLPMPGDEAAALTRQAG